MYFKQPTYLEYGTMSECDLLFFTWNSAFAAARSVLTYRDLIYNIILIYNIMSKTFENGNRSSNCVEFNSVSGLH